MPNQNAFGLETPGGALQVIRNLRANRAASLPPPSSESQALGRSLGNIFTSVRQKGQETRDARARVEDRIIEETGVSREQARAMAKEQVPRDFQKVREAKGVELANTIAQEVIEQQTPFIGAPRARAQGMRVMSIQLRRLFMDDEANAMMEQAEALDQKVTNDELAVRLVKAQVSKAEQEAEEFNARPIEEAQKRQTELEVAIDKAGPGPEKEKLEEQLRQVKMDIEKILHISVSSQFDSKAVNLLATPQKKLIDELQKSYFSTLNTLDRLAATGRGFEPDFLRYGGRVKAGIAKIKDFFGIPMSDEEKIFFLKQGAFMRNAFVNLNLYIKEITGAQMSAVEAVRLGKGIPNPDTDSPLLFRSKLIETVREVLAIRRRIEAALRPGGNMAFLPAEIGGTGSNEDDFELIRAFLPDEDEVIRLLGLDTVADTGENPAPLASEVIKVQGGTIDVSGIKAVEN